MLRRITSASFLAGITTAIRQEDCCLRNGKDKCLLTRQNPPCASIKYSQISTLRIPAMRTSIESYCRRYQGTGCKVHSGSVEYCGKFESGGMHEFSSDCRHCRRCSYNCGDGDLPGLEGGQSHGPCSSVRAVHAQRRHRYVPRRMPGHLSPWHLQGGRHSALLYILDTGYRAMLLSTASGRDRLCARHRDGRRSSSGRPVDHEVTWAENAGGR